MPESLFNKVGVPQPANLLKKKRSPQLFSCELFKIITKHLQETVPKNKREFYEILYPHGCSYGKCWFQFQLHLSVLFFSFGSTEKALEYI